MEQNWNLPDKPKRKRRRFWLKLAAGLLFAVVAYGGAYAVLVHPAWGFDLQVNPVRTPRYGFTRDTAVSPLWLGLIFLPAHIVDRYCIRPEVWRD